MMLLVSLIYFVTKNCFCSHEADNIQEIFTSIYNQPMKQQFKAFHFHFDRPYDLNSQEGLNRYRIFKSNLKFIKQTNAKNLGYTLGVNQFADLTIEEYKNTYINKNIEQQDTEFKRNFMVLFDDDDDDLFINQSDDNYPNWENYLPPARNQKGCGSCWVFSILGALEGNYSIKYGKKLDLSRQDLVDCDTKNYACEGGVTERAMEFLQKNGVAYENAYPYVSGFTGDRGVCKKDIVRQKLLKSYKGGSGESQFNSLLTQGPLKVNMDGTSAEFVFYQSGVVKLPCKAINHGVIAIGRGVEDGKEYIYVRNSHGKNWGIRGNIKIQVNRSDLTCFIQNSPYLLEPNEATVPEPPAPEKSCIVVSNDCGGKGENFEICNTTSYIPFKTIIDKFSAKFNKFEGKKVSFFSEKECAGRRVELIDDIQCFYSRIGSLLIHKEDAPPAKCIWLYEDACHSGKRYEICDKLTDLKANGYTAGSFILGSNIKGVRLFSGVRALYVQDTTYRILLEYYKNITKIELDSK